MNAPGSSFYITGGTLSADAPCYVKRRADDELYEGLRRGDYCHVLTPRQMGKSSLMGRTAARLRSEGYAVVSFEVTGRGQNLTIEQWYYSMLKCVGEQLDLLRELREFWTGNAELGPLNRWFAALRDVVLPGCPGPVVILLDEIDSVRNLPFNTDEFFAGIRTCYNERTEDPELKRLAFGMMGVATPADLIQNPHTTPFNIGRRISLTDFTEEEAQPLAQGFALGDAANGGVTEAQAQALLRRVLYWTSGHPYLTQRLCEAVAVRLASRLNGETAGQHAPLLRQSPQRLVDELCEELFLAPGGRDRDDNLAFVRDELVRGAKDLAAVLELYARIRNGRRVTDDEHSPHTDILRLSGIVGVGPAHRGSTRFPRPRWVSALLRGSLDFGRSQPHLHVRNRIYETVFDQDWIAELMPDAEQKRQRGAYRKGMLRATALSVVVVAGLGGSIVAVHQTNVAETRRQENRQTEYVLQMSQAFAEVELGDYDGARTLLNAQRPARGEPDLRGWEWRYLWGVCNQDALTLEGHEGPVVPIQFLADRQRLATFSTGSGGQIWSAGGVLQEAPELPDLCYAGAFSPDGRKFVGVVGVSDSRAEANGPAELQRDIVAWDITTGSGEPLHSSQGYTYKIAISPNGRFLAAGRFSLLPEDTPGKVIVWDCGSWLEIASLQGHLNSITSLAFSNDSRLLVTGDKAGSVRVWDTRTWQATKTLRSQMSWVDCVAVTHRGQMVAFGSHEPGGDSAVEAALEVCPLGSGQDAKPSRGFAGVILDVAFSPNGSSLVTGDSEGVVTVWDTRASQLLTQLRGHSGPVWSVAVSPDGDRIATGGQDGTAKLWRLDTTPLVREWSAGDSEVNWIAFSPDSRLIATSGNSLRTRLWELATGSEIELPKAFRGGPVVFSSDGTSLVVGLARAVRAWNLRTGEESVLVASRSNITCIASAADGRLAVGDEEGNVRVLSPTGGRGGASITCPGPIESLAFAHNETSVAIGTKEGTLLLWDVDSPAPNHLQSFQTSILGLAWAPDDAMLAVTNLKMLILWDIGRRKGTPIPGPAEWIKSVSFFPDGITLAAGDWDSPSIRLWSVAARNEVGRLTGFPEGTLSVAVSSDGTWLATGGKHGGIRLWRAPPTDVRRRRESHSSAHYAQIHAAISMANELRLIGRSR